MQFNTVIQLIGRIHVSSSSGDDITDTPPREVFAERKSIRQSEVYQALANGLRPEVSFVMWSIEYNDEQRIEYDGKMYEIIRTSIDKDIRLIELICQPLDLVKTGLSRLRDTIEIWHNTSVENTMGEQSPKSVLLYTVQAEIAYAGGGTSKLDGTIETTNNAVVKIVYREGINSAMFLKIDGQRWDIKYLEDPYNRHETLMLTAERVIS